MKQFLIRVVVFFTIVLVIAWALDWMICQGLLKMEDYRFQDYSAMLKGGMEHEVLIMGNSRGKSHYDTYLIDSLGNTSSFCIGCGGYPLSVQLVKYDLYREHNKKPAIIIQELDYATLRRVDDVRHQHQSEQFFPLIYDRGMRKRLKDIGYGFGELCIPLYRMYGYQQVIKNGLLEFSGLKHYVSRPAYKGHRPEEGDWDGTGLKEMESSVVSVSEEGKELLEEYLTRCRTDSIQVVLVYSPMYVGAKEKLIGLDQVLTAFKETAERYGFAYLNYLDCPICNDTSNFCVSVHMNPEATKQFTQQFMNDLKTKYETNDNHDQQE